MDFLYRRESELFVLKREEEYFLHNRFNCSAMRFSPLTKDLINSRCLIIRRGITSFSQRLRGSHVLQRALKNAGWSGAGFLLLPALQLATTPILLPGLGIEVFGIWMLINSILAVSGIASFGLGAATVKFVSQYLARNDRAAVIKVIRSTMAVYVGLGFLAAVILFFLAPVLAENVFAVDETREALLTTGIRIACLALVMRFAYGVIESVAEGFSRYDLQSRFAMLNTSATLLGAVILVHFGYGLLEILILSVAVIAVGFFGLALVVARLTGTCSWLCPMPDTTIMREVFGFAFWSWGQSMGGILFNQLDRIIIAGFLGAAPLAYYTVCLQLTTLVHGLLARTTSFVFPLASSLKESKNPAVLLKLYSHSMPLVTAVGCALAVPLFLFSHDILRHWLGVEVADNAAPLLSIIAIAAAAGAGSIIPYHLMHGWGFVRLSAIIGFLSGAVIALSALLLIPYIGLLGAAWARLTSVPLGILSRTFVHWNVLQIHRYSSGILILVPVALVFLIAWALMLSVELPALNLLHLLIAIGFVFVVTFALAYLIGTLVTRILIKSSLLNLPAEVNSSTAGAQP